MKSIVPFKSFLSFQLVMAAGLPVITIAILVWLFVMPAMKTQTNNMDQAITRSIAGRISAYLDGGERQLTALAEYLQNEGSDPGRTQIGLLDAQCGKGEFFQALFIADNENMVIQRVGLAQGLRLKRDNFIGLDLSGRSIFHAANNLQDAVWSEIFPSAVNNRMAVALTVPLSNGFITGEITLDNLSEFISHFQAESEWLILIIDGQGMIVADSQKLRRGQMLNNNNRLLREATGGAPLSSMVFKLDGEQMLGTLVAMDNRSGWNVLVAQPDRITFKPIRNTFLLIMLGLAIALVLALSLFRFLAGYISNLYRAYAESNQSITDGRNDVKWPKAKTNESKQLGQGLQRMAEKISRREKALLESERRLKELIANIPGVVYQFKSTRDHVYTNEFLGKKTTEIFGLEPDLKTFIDEFYNHIPDDEKEQYLNSVQQAVDRVEPWNYEGRFTKPDGETIWFSGTAVPREEGEFIVFYGVLMDITQRKEIEASLRLTQFCFDSASVGIYHLQSDGRILNLNGYAALMLGYTIEELSGSFLWKIDPYANAEGLASGWCRLAATGVDIFETTHLRKDGTRIPVEVTANFLEYDGRQFSICFVQDITERKRTEKSLQITQFSVDKANIGIFRIASDARIKEVNQKAVQLLGYTKEELENLYIYDIDPSVTRKTWGSMWQALVDEGSFVHERVHRRKDGVIIPTDVYVNFLEYESRQYAIAFIQDISERKRMEQALKESEERLDLALSGANEGIWDWRITEDTLFLDFRYYTMAGYQPNEYPAVYDEILKRIHKDDVERVKMANYQYLAGTRETFEVEFRFQRKDGSYMWILAKGRIVARDEEGTPLRFSGTNTDITDRKQAEEALKENERLLNNILESMNEGLLVLDNDFRCTIFNSSLEKMAGKTKEEAIGIPPWESFPSLKDTVVEKNIQKTMTGESAGNQEIQLPLPNGEMVWFRDSFSPLKDDNDNVIGVVGVISDITEKKHAENEREKLLKELQEALENVKTLRGLLPICSLCKKIRDDKGYWNQIEFYIHAHSEAEFSHSICPECAKKLYPYLDLDTNGD